MNHNKKIIVLSYLTQKRALNTMKQKIIADSFEKIKFFSESRAQQVLEQNDLSEICQLKFHHSHLTKIMHSINDLEIQLAIYFYADKKYPDLNYLWNFYLARTYQNNEMFDIAEGLYLNYIEKESFDDQKARAYYALGYMYGALENHEKARDYFKKVTELDANNHEAWCYLGLEKNMLGIEDKGYPEIFKATQIAPHEVDLWQKLANALYGDHKKADAYDTLEYGLSQSKSYNENAWGNLGFFTIQHPDYLKSLEKMNYKQIPNHFHLFFKQKPKMAELGFSFGTNYEYATHEKLITSFVGLLIHNLKENGNIDVDHHIVMLDLLLKGQMILSPQNNYRTYVFYAEIFYYMQNYGSSINFTIEALVSSGLERKLNILYAAAKLYGQNKNLLVSFFSKIILSDKLKESRYDIVASIPLWFDKTKDYETLKNIFLEVVKQEPRYALAWAYAGYGAYLNHQSTEADQYFEKAFSITKKDPEIWGSLAESLSRLGKNEEAEKVILQALEVMPEDSFLRKVYAEYLSLKENRLKQENKGFLLAVDFGNGVEMVEVSYDQEGSPIYPEKLKKWIESPSFFKSTLIPPAEKDTKNRLIELFSMSEWDELNFTQAKTIMTLGTLPFPNISDLIKRFMPEFKIRAKKFEPDIDS